MPGSISQIWRRAFHLIPIRHPQSVALQPRHDTAIVVQPVTGTTVETEGVAAAGVAHHLDGRLARRHQAKVKLFPLPDGATVIRLAMQEQSRCSHAVHVTYRREAAERFPTGKEIAVQLPGAEPHPDVGGTVHGL